MSRPDRPRVRAWHLLVLSAAVLLLPACAPAADPEAAPAEKADAGSSPTPATAACGPVEEPPVQAGGHLIGDEEPPVPYSSQPPTSGWHTSGAFEIDIRDEDDPLSEPRQVSVLEAGAVVVTHRGLPPAERERLEGFVTERFPERVAVTPYDALEPGQMALTAWGVLQVCDGVNLDALEAFVEEHAAQDPGTPGTHEHTPEEQGSNHDHAP